MIDVEPITVSTTVNMTFEIFVEEIERWRRLRLDSWNVIGKRYRHRLT